MIPANEIEYRLSRFALERAHKLIASAGPKLVDLMGGPDKVTGQIVRRAMAARDALTLSPRERLARFARHWSEIVQARISNPDPIPVDIDDLEWDDDPDMGVKVDRYLLTRLGEIETRLRDGDTDGAFDVLRRAYDKRPGEEYMICLPDPLDVTSAYWIDLDPEH